MDRKLFLQSLGATFAAAQGGPVASLASKAAASGLASSPLSKAFNLFFRLKGVAISSPENVAPEALGTAVEAVNTALHPLFDYLRNTPQEEVEAAYNAFHTKVVEPAYIAAGEEAAKVLLNSKDTLPFGLISIANDILRTDLSPAKKYYNTRRLLRLVNLNLAKIPHPGPLFTEILKTLDGRIENEIKDFIAKKGNPIVTELFSLRNDAMPETFELSSLHELAQAVGSNQNDFTYGLLNFAYPNRGTPKADALRILSDDEFRLRQNRLFATIADKLEIPLERRSGVGRKSSAQQEEINADKKSVQEKTSGKLRPDETEEQRSALMARLIAALKKKQEWTAQVESKSSQNTPIPHR